MFSCLVSAYPWPLWSTFAGHMDSANAVVETITMAPETIMVATTLPLSKLLPNKRMQAMREREDPSVLRGKVQLDEAGIPFT